MYHLRFKGNHYDIGVKRGKIFKKCNIKFPLNMDEFQMKHGIESEKVLSKYFKEVCEEVKGITETLEIDYYKFISWLLAMGCCMYNLEDNFPVEIRGCTGFAINYKNHIYYGRNNDLPPYLKKNSKSEIYKITNRNKFNITTSSFINGEEGINEKGLTVAMTFVGTKFEDKCPDLNINGEWVEHEGFISKKPKNAFRNMLNDGLIQSNKLIIDKPELTEAYMKRVIRNRIKEGQDINEIWIFDGKETTLLYKKSED